MTSLFHRIPAPAVARGLVRLPLFVCLLVLARSGIAAHDTPAPLPVQNFAAVGIETTPASPAVAKWLTHLPAHVQIPNAQLRVVASPVGGLVTAVLVGPGEPVDEGRALARVVSPELLGLQRELAQASAERERTQRALVRDERLLAEGLIAASRVEATRAADRQATAALAEKRGLLALAGGRPGPAGELSVLAPMSGVVLAQTVRAGERVEPATALFTIARLDPLDLDIEVPFGAATHVGVGSAVRVPSTGASGSVISIGRAVSDGQTLTLRARMTAGLVGLNPGQHVEAEVETSGREGATTLWQVPASALVRLGPSGTQPAVFVQRDGQYFAVAAKPAGEAGRDLVVEAALRDGEPVVSRGASQLKAALAGLGERE